MPQATGAPFRAHGARAKGQWHSSLLAACPHHPRETPCGATRPEAVSEPPPAIMSSSPRSDEIVAPPLEFIVERLEGRAVQPNLSSDATLNTANLLAEVNILWRDILSNLSPVRWRVLVELCFIRFVLFFIFYSSLYKVMAFLFISTQTKPVNL